MGIGHCKRRKKKFTAHIYRRNISREMDDSCQRDAKKMREWLSSYRAKHNCIWNFQGPTNFPGPGQLSQYSDSLRAGRSGGSNPGGGRDLPCPSRPVLGPTPASYAMGTGTRRWPPIPI